MPLRAIVFDFDGVIADSEPLHFRSFRDVLAGEGVELTQDDYYARYLGFNDVEAFRAIGREHRRSWSTTLVADLARQKAERMATLERDAPVLFPGAADTIRRAAEAVPIAIASGALGSEIRRILDRAGLTREFTAIVAAEDTAASKPSPDPYQRALALLSRAVDGVEIRPGDCVAIEDSRWGLASARAAGLRTVAVTNSYDATELASADLIIPSIARLDLMDLHRLCATGA